MHIRQYQPQDKEAVRDLHIMALKAAGAFYQSGWWDADLDDIEECYLNDGGEFLVGLIDEAIVVMGALRKIDEAVVELKRMRVHPDCQRQGHGQIMLATLEARARALNYKVIQLDTTLQQEAAQKLYEKNGYVETHREVEGKPFEIIYYRKDL
jgi:ribosomal protein S18 acetylase RimI-like enzyme